MYRSQNWLTSTLGFVSIIPPVVSGDVITGPEVLKNNTCANVSRLFQSNTATGKHCSRKYMNSIAQQPTCKNYKLGYSASLVHYSMLLLSIAGHLYAETMFIGITQSATFCNCWLQRLSFLISECTSVFSPSAPIKLNQPQTNTEKIVMAEV